MSRVILKYRNIAQGKMKSIYLDFNLPFMTSRAIV